MRKSGRVGHEGEAEYFVEGDPPLVRVVSAYGEKSADLGNLSPEWLARQLLSEMIAGGPGEMWGLTPARHYQIGWGGH